MADEKTLIRVGKVSAVDAGAKKARVFYPGMHNMVSGWLPVLQFPGLKSGGWMPAVNDKVVVLMEYGFNSGGYILGVVS